MDEQLKAGEQCECPTRKALEAMPCRCMKLVSANNCPQCGGLLHPVQYPSNSMLNRDQFDATRAGDFYCESCKGAEARSGFKYFWESDFPVRIEKCTRCAALQSPCPCEALRQEIAGMREQRKAPLTTEVGWYRASMHSAQAAEERVRNDNYRLLAERDSLRAELTASQERERVLRAVLKDAQEELR